MKRFFAMQLSFAAFGIGIAALSICYMGYAISWKQCRLHMPQGEFKDADTHCQRAVAFLRPFKLLWRVQYRDALNTLGLVDIYLQRYELAKVHLEEFLEVSRAIAPGGSGNEATALSNLAMVSGREGDANRELRRLEQAVKLFETLRLTCDPASAHASANLGRVLVAAHRVSDAYQVLSRRVRENARCAALPTSVRGNAYRGLAETQSLMGERENAMESYSQAVSILREEGKESLELAYVYVERGRDLMRIGRRSESVQDLEMAKPILNRLVGHDSLEIAIVHHILADDLQSERRYDEAIENYVAADRNIVAKLGADHPRRVQLLSSLAQADSRIGKMDDASAALREAKRIAIKRFGPASNEYAAIKAAAAGVGLSF